MDEIALTVVYTEQDFVGSADGFQGQRKIFNVVALGLATALSGIAGYLGILPTDLVLIIPIAVGFCLFAFIPLITNCLTRQNFRVRSDVKDQFEFKYSDSGVEATSARMSGKNYWSVFIRAIETPETFLLFYGKNVYFVIPKKSFVDEAQIAAFRQLVFSKVPNFKIRKLRGIALGRVSKPVFALLIAFLTLVGISFWVALYGNSLSSRPIR